MKVTLKVTLHVLAFFPLSSVTSLGCREGQECLGEVTMRRKPVYSDSERVLLPGSSPNAGQRVGGHADDQSTEVIAPGAQVPQVPSRWERRGAEGLEGGRGLHHSGVNSPGC